MIRRQSSERTFRKAPVADLTLVILCVSLACTRHIHLSSHSQLFQKFISAFFCVFVTSLKQTKRFLASAFCRVSCRQFSVSFSDFFGGF